MKNIFYTSVIIMLLLLSCNKYEIGNWYENIQTKERIKVLDIGLPKDIILRHREKVNSVLGDSLLAITVLDYDSTKYADVECFMYYKSGNRNWLAIKPIEILNQDYLRIK